MVLRLPSKVPHLLTLADLTTPQITRIIQHSLALKQTCEPWLVPQGLPPRLRLPSQSLFNKNIALLFSKRSTRTRLAAETASELLGGSALFLGREDIQLGVNESLRDSARVIGGMCQGIFARVGDHSEIEEMTKYSPVPVLNALSSLWHPTQILADLLTIHEHAEMFHPAQVEPAPIDPLSLDPPPPTADSQKKEKKPFFTALPALPALTIAYLGDSTNVLHDMLVTYPRYGHKLQIATPPAPQYQCPEPVWDRVKQLECDKLIEWSNDPKAAVKGADIVVTDTWISMGQEAEKAQRLQDFKGYQVTEALCREGGAKEDWKFLHCLPRKPDEVDDEVFYGPRSLVFPEADNRKWTIMALFDLLFGKWDLTSSQRPNAIRVKANPRGGSKSIGQKS
ncbi:ornithine carbamoyltransferase [Hysterangium stoloniferum]|nr:ornithine carbamoyltransferase [Hysterangium stoloniferum]